MIFLGFLKFMCAEYCLMARGTYKPITSNFKSISRFRSHVCKHLSQLLASVARKFEVLKPWASDDEEGLCHDFISEHHVLWDAHVKEDWEKARDARRVSRFLFFLRRCDHIGRFAVKIYILDLAVASVAFS